MGKLQQQVATSARRLIAYVALLLVGLFDLAAIHMCVDFIDAVAATAFQCPRHTSRLGRRSDT